MGNDNMQTCCKCNTNTGTFRVTYRGHFCEKCYSKTFKVFDETFFISDFNVTMHAKHRGPAFGSTLSYSYFDIVFSKNEQTYFFDFKKYVNELPSKETLAREFVKQYSWASTSFFVNERFLSIVHKQLKKQFDKIGFSVKENGL